MVSSKILHSHSKSDDFENSFNYRTVIGKLNFLEKATHPDLAYAAHQCGLKVHVDSDFVGSWDPDNVHNSDMVKSCHGYVISFAGCPICWKSQLQPHITLSSSKAEYIGLSAALYKALLIINLMEKKLSRDGATIFSDIMLQLYMRYLRSRTPTHQYMPTSSLYRHIHLMVHDSNKIGLRGGGGGGCWTCIQTWSPHYSNQPIMRIYNPLFSPLYHKYQDDTYVQYTNDLK